MPLPPAGQIAGIYHRRVGDIVVTALSDGFFITEREMTRNLAREELAQALAASFRDTVIFSVNAFIIRAGGRIALLETGSGNYLGPTLGHLIGNMQAAGVMPAEVDTVLLTHMHPDHSAGLTDMMTGARNFPNAELVVHENEPRHWYDDGKMAAASDLYKHLHFQMTREQTRPYLDRMRTFVEGEVFPGVTAIPSHGHTPGHTSFLIASAQREPAGVGRHDSHSRGAVRAPRDRDGAGHRSGRRRRVAPPHPRHGGVGTAAGDRNAHAFPRLRPRRARARRVPLPPGSVAADVVRG